jgi:Rab-GTPase-TBC domain
MDQLLKKITESTSSSMSSSSVSDQLWKETQRQKAANARHKQVVVNTITWKEKIIPKFSEYRHSKKVRDLCYRGIPPSLRGKVWSMLIGNAHKISDEYYEQLVKVADLLYLEAAEREDRLDLQYQADLEDIRKDESCKEEDQDSFHTAKESVEGGEEEKLGDQDEVDGDEDDEDEEESEDESEEELGNELDEGFIDDDEVIISPSHKFTTKDAHLEFEAQDEEVAMIHRSALYDICENDINQSDLRQISELTAGVSDVKNHLLSIERDLPRTFPTLAFFHDGGPLELSLRRILRAFACFKTDIGYVQGMSFVVAMLLLYMDEIQAFRCLVNLIEKRGGIGRGFYKLDHSSVTRFVGIFDEYFKLKLPQLFNHMMSEQISSEMFLIDWNLTLFSKALSLESAARVWDCFLLDGETFVVKASLGILRCLSSKIRSKSLEEILPLLTHFPAEIETDKLMESIFQMKISRTSFEFKLCPLVGAEAHMTHSSLMRIGSRLKKTMELFSSGGERGGSNAATPAKSDGGRAFTNNKLNEKDEHLAADNQNQPVFEKFRSIFGLSS